MPSELIVFVPAYLAVGTMLTIAQCLRGSRPNKKRSRTPLLGQYGSQKKQSAPKKVRKHWWQFWRKRAAKTMDLEQGFGTTGGYGTMSSSERADSNSSRLSQKASSAHSYSSRSTQRSVFAESSSLPDGFTGFDGAPLTAFDDDIWLDSTVASSYSSIPDSVISNILHRSNFFENPRPAPSPPTKKQSPPPLPSAPLGEFEPAYTIIRKLRHENEGKLFLVRYNRTSKLYIIKQMKMRQSQRTGKFHMPTEAHVLREGFKTFHPNILDLQGYWENPETGVANIVYEYCDAGDVENLMEAFKDRPGEAMHPMFVLHFVVGMMKALAFVHDGKLADFKNGVAKLTTVKGQAPYIHEDIKPGNVFLRWSKDSRFGMPDVVLGDFGFACIDDDNNYGACGTPGYWPPEVEQNISLRYEDPDRYWDARVWSQEGDMYSFGVSLFQLITLTKYRPSANISRAVNQSRLIEFPEAAAVITGLLEECLDKQAAWRPRATNYLNWCAHFQGMIEQWYAEGGRIPKGMFPDPFYHDNSIQSLEMPALKQKKPPTWKDMPPESVSSFRDSVPEYSVQNPYAQSDQILIDNDDAVAGAEQSMSPYQLSTDDSSEHSRSASSSSSGSVQVRQLERAMSGFAHLDQSTEAGAEKSIKASIYHSVKSSDQQPRLTQSNPQLISGFDWDD